MKKSNGYWNFERCLEEAKKYNTRSDWRNASRSSYVIAHAKGWVEKCTNHMQKLISNYTLNDLKKIAKKYESRYSWLLNDSKSYHKASYNNWLEKCCAHMKKYKAQKWTKENCIIEAKKYNTRKDWRSFSPTSYNIALRKNWYTECTAHMGKKYERIT